VLSGACWGRNWVREAWPQRWWGSFEDEQGSIPLLTFTLTHEMKDNINEGGLHEINIERKIQNASECNRLQWEVYKLLLSKTW
jgi:hypothetical protein